MQNELPEWCPQWAWDEAYRLASQVVAERGPRMETFQPIVARALVAAERRGIERAAKVAEKYGDGGLEYDLEPEACVATSVASKSIAAAIRQLGDRPCT